MDGNSRTEPVADHEAVTGIGGRRRCPDELNARLAAESHADGTKAGEAARRAGLHPNCLPHWRRQAREGAPAMPGAGGADFVEVELAAAPDAGGWIGIVHGGTAVRLGGGGARGEDRGDRPCAERSAAMRVPGRGARRLLAAKPVGFRKGHDGLAAFAEPGRQLAPWRAVPDDPRHRLDEPSHILIGLAGAFPAHAMRPDGRPLAVVCKYSGHGCSTSLFFWVCSLESELCGKGNPPGNVPANRYCR